MTCANQVSRLQTSSLSRFSMRANGRMKSFNYFKTNIKARRARNRDLQIQARQLKVQRKRRNASFVVRPKGIQSPPIAQLMFSNVEFVRRWITSAKCVCQAKIAEKKSILQKKQKSMIMIQRNPLLMIEEISAVEGRGKQMASSITRWPTTATAKLSFALVIHTGYP